MGDSGEDSGDTMPTRKQYRRIMSSIFVKRQKKMSKSRSAWEREDVKELERCDIT